jgi:RsiW-degrading membrane proteinase PrsW (M82 family)
MKISQPSSARQPGDTRTSTAFRVLVAVATCFVVVLGFKTQSNPISGPLAWCAVLLVSGCVFVLADWLLALLVVGIPPGLFVLALVGLMTHGS